MLSIKNESLREGSFSNLANMVKNSSIFNARYAEFSMKRQVLLHFHNPTCAYNHLYNLHQKSAPLLQATFTSLFLPYFLTKSSLQSPVIFPSTIPQQFFTSIFFRITIPSVYIKNNFPISAIQPIQVASMDQEPWESCRN